MGEHDENISFERTVEMVGADLATRIRDYSLALYRAACDMRNRRRASSLPTPSSSLVWMPMAR